MERNTTKFEPKDGVWFDQHNNLFGKRRASSQRYNFNSDYTLATVLNETK